MKISLAQSLFALAGASVAVLLVVAGYVSLDSSDGRFWGIDPKMSPETAAEEAWENFDSIRDFADSYNFRMRDLLEKATDARCWGFDVG